MNKIFKLQDSTSSIIIAVLLFVWIIFAVFNYYLNPPFFGITIIISSLLILFGFGKREIVITDTELIFKRYNLLGRIKNSNSISFKNISNCELKSIKLDFVQIVVSFFTPMAGDFRVRQYLILYKKDGTSQEIELFGSKTNRIELINRLKNCL